MPQAPSAPFWRSSLPLALAVGLALLGGSSLWFFCDDAFITFRFCGNAHDGHGFVWNVAPFAPVEGYTSFLWMWVLWALWGLTGIEPPQLAIPITFACGLLILWAVARRLAQIRLPERAEAWRPWLQGAVLLGIAGNHSFATWLSSGLETAIFALWVVLWVLRATAVRGAASVRDLLELGVWAALAHLTRPDGDLLVFATLAIAAHTWIRHGLSARRVVFGITPVLVPIAHVCWRRWYYGEWLPNTYYAKVTAAWPESGMRFLYCFAMEHGVWLWLPFALVWLVVATLRHGALRALFAERFSALAAVGTILAQVGYYTIVVGGDHFAYRVFVHAVPLMFFAAFAMGANLRLPRGLLLAGLGTFAVVADTPGWVIERALVGREADGFVRVADLVPAALRPLVAEYDRCSAWLHLHSVAFRRPVHALFCGLARAQLPQRAAGQIQGAQPGQRLVYRADAVGVVSWALSDVAILDGHGLSDWVIARNKVPLPVSTFDFGAMREAFPVFDGDHDQRLDAKEIASVADRGLLNGVGPALHSVVWAELLLSLGDRDDDQALTRDELAEAIAAILPPRHMAHERAPPDGYIEALRPNVMVVDGQYRVQPDVVPLTDEEVRATEQRFRALVRR
jgi:arabinofuranosyltransferase